MKIQIEKLVHGGAGMARTPEGVLFVTGVLPGERVDVEVVDRRKDYARARLREVLEPSPHRRLPKCPNSEAVGCCDWGHIEYSHQLELKDAIVREVLRRHGNIQWDHPIERTHSPESGYRLRAAFHVTTAGGSPRLGFVAAHTHRVVPIDRCDTLMPAINQFLEDAGALLDGRSLRDGDRVRVVASPDTGETAASVHRGRERLSCSVNNPRTRVLGIEYRLRPDCFFQPNRHLLEAMATDVVEACRDRGQVLDLFCGSGFLSLPVARVAGQVTGADRRSVSNAVWNARHNRIENVHYVRASAWAFLLNARGRPDLVILDPPRTGAGKNVVKRVSGLQPEVVVYLSCNPSTFAPEARILLDQGYQLASLQFIDQFPNTSHIETMALFRQR